MNALFCISYFLSKFLCTRLTPKVLISGGNTTCKLVTKRLNIWGSLSRLVGTGYLDEIPFKQSFPLKNTFSIIRKNFPIPTRRMRNEESRLVKMMFLHVIVSSRQTGPEWMFLCIKLVNKAFHVRNWKELLLSYFRMKKSDCNSK